MALPAGSLVRLVPVPLLALFSLLLLAACGPMPGRQSGAPETAALGETFALSIGQTATIEPEQITVTLDKVLEDSRCPANVTCVWSGQLIVEVTIAHGGAPQGTFQLNSIDAFRKKDIPVFESYNIAVLKATPSRVYENFGKPGSSIRTPAPNEYAVSFAVNQIAQGIVPANRGELGQRVQLGVGQAADFAAEGLLVRFAALVEDTRCPKSPLISCYHAGTATVRLELAKGALSNNVDLVIPGLVDDTALLSARSRYTTEFAGYRVQLVSLAPMPTDPNTPKPAPDAYTATLLVMAG